MLSGYQDVGEVNVLGVVGLSGLAEKERLSGYRGVGVQKPKVDGSTILDVNYPSAPAGANLPCGLSPNEGNRPQLGVPCKLFYYFSLNSSIQNLIFCESKPTITYHGRTLA